MSGIAEQVWPDVQWFCMDRVEDETGISGTGVIAYVLSLPSGVMVFWDTGWKSFEWLADLKTLEDVHGHNGKTRFVAHDEGHPRLERARELTRVLPEVMAGLADYVTTNLREG